MREVRCSGCGAVVPDATGPVHAYMHAAPGCWALYCGVICSGGPQRDLDVGVPEGAGEPVPGGFGGLVDPLKSVIRGFFTANTASESM